MTRAGFFLALVLMIPMEPDWARAEKTYRVGAAIANDQSIPAIEGFQKKMAELGYREEKNIHCDLYNAKGDQEDLKKLALKLVQDGPDVIVTSSTTATAPVAKATAGTNNPVVFLSAGNPLSFVKSYASSGNNLTGISAASIDLTEKRLELLKELTPGIKLNEAIIVNRRLARLLAKRINQCLVETKWLTT